MCLIWYHSSKGVGSEDTQVYHTQYHKWGGFKQQFTVLEARNPNQGVSVSILPLEALRKKAYPFWCLLAILGVLGSWLFHSSFLLHIHMSVFPCVCLCLCVQISLSFLSLFFFLLVVRNIYYYYSLTIIQHQQYIIQSIIQYKAGLASQFLSSRNLFKLGHENEKDIHLPGKKMR